jgi:hypothetical protein
MRFFFAAIMVALFAGCLASDISLDELYKRAEAQSHPKPAPKVDREQQEWSTDNLLGWNKPNEQEDVINSMLKRHNIQSKELDDDENEVVAEPKVAPKPVHKAVHETHKAKVKAVKVALVTKGLAKAKKVHKKVQNKVPKKAKKASPASIVPEVEHAEMLNSHFFDGSKATPQAKKATRADSNLNGMHLMGMAPALKPSVHATNALTHMASDLLSEATEKVNAKVAKKAAAAKAAKAAVASKVAQAKAAKAAKAKKAKKAAASVDPFKMNLSEAEGSNPKVIDEKKLPSLGSFLGDDDEDDDEY